MQAELSARSKANSKESKKFFKEMVVQSKQMLINTKYKQPSMIDEDELNWSVNPILDHLPLYQQSPRLPSSSNFENDFLLERGKLRDHDIKIGSLNG